MSDAANIRANEEPLLRFFYVAHVNKTETSGNVQWLGKQWLNEASVSETVTENLDHAAKFTVEQARELVARFSGSVKSRHHKLLAFPVASINEKSVRVVERSRWYFSASADAENNDDPFQFLTLGGGEQC